MYVQRMCASRSRRPATARRSAHRAGAPRARGRRRRRKAVDHVRVVAEQDPQVGLRVGQPLGMRPPQPVRARVDPDDLHPLAAELERARVVGEEGRRLEVVDLGRVRERVAGEREIVVPEHREAVRQPREQRTQPRLAAAAREQVAADQRQVGPALLDPGDRVARPPPSRERESRGGSPRGAQSAGRPARAAAPGSGHASVSSRTQPASKCPQPGRACTERGADRRKRRGITLFLEELDRRADRTTCRLNWSSESSSPAATPISCERWRIGI